MKVVEHKSKELFRKYGIPVPSGKVAATPEEAQAAAAEILDKAPSAVLKAQVLSGGRGKGKVIKDGRETGGGVRIVRSGAEAAKETASLLGGRLVTVQNRAGLQIDSILVEEGVDFSQQMYLALTVDRAARSITCISSCEGGTEIEQLAAVCPEKIVKMNVDAETGWMPFHGRTLAARLGVKKELHKALSAVGKGMADLFVQQDCSLAEINPLVVTGDGRLVALDAKIVIDDNSLARHPELAEAAVPLPEEEIEFEAKKAGLSYIKLDGDIGCLVNGAGLAMATMDIIKFYGGEPANFLDVGGTASEEAVKKAFTIILSDPAVRAIFVNIFGGIMRCDVIAKGIVGATRQLGLKTPLVVRLEGNMVEDGRTILAESGLKITAADGMGDGAQKVVQASGMAAPGL
jgi:succinyl-CoA synthetase beta subunit